MCYLDICNKSSDLFRAIDSLKTSTSEYIKIKRGNILISEYKIVRTVKDIESLRNKDESKDGSILKKCIYMFNRL